MTAERPSSSPSKIPLVVLAAAQFLMVLDSAVMNVSISQLVADFDTDVSTVQAVITFYALVMAAFMITGGKLGDRWGRVRTFAIGIAVYAVGSLVTALAPTVGVLALGWSVIEGVGAALVMPAMVALVGGMYTGRARAMAYGVLGGVAGAGVAVGPILGGWVTANATWRLVFVGEVIVALAILAGVRVLREPERTGRPPQIDWAGAALSSIGLALVVFGVLQSSAWGWITPRNSPMILLGLPLTLWVIGAGAAVLAAFGRWQRHRERRGLDPLVHLDSFANRRLRSGLTMLLAQNLILMGIFFSIPLYLQVVQGFDAFETGLRMLPISVTLFLASAAGPTLGARLSPRTICRIGMVVLFVATLALLGRIEPEIDELGFLVAMGVLGIGMGLIASQLGNVVQSSVDESGRGEAGGLQYTAQQFGGALGTALIGAVVLGGLATSFSALVERDPAITGELAAAVEVEVSAGVPFAPSSAVREALDAAGIAPDEADALIADFDEAKLTGLRIGLVVAALIIIGGFAVAGRLPDEPLARDPEPAPDPGPVGPDPDPDPEPVQAHPELDPEPAEAQPEPEPQERERGPEPVA